MARARNIKPAFFTNEDLAELPFEARLLFIGLWTLADREGRLENRPKKIKMSLFPADEINVIEQLNNIYELGFIDLYNCDGKDVIQINNFSKHQKPHGLEKDSDLPSREGVYTVYERNPKNKTIVGKPIHLRINELDVFYNKTGEKAEKTVVNQSNGGVENSQETVIEQLNNSYETVSKQDTNALNPDSLNPDSLNPDSLNVDSINTPLTPLGELSDKPDKKPKRQNGSRLPADFVMPDEWLTWAKQENPSFTDASLRLIADKFKDYWISVAGAKGAKLDWFATWRNWVRSDFNKPITDKNRNGAIEIPRHFSDPNRDYTEGTYLREDGSRGF